MHLESEFNWILIQKEQKSVSVALCDRQVAMFSDDTARPHNPSCSHKASASLSLAVELNANESSLHRDHNFMNINQLCSVVNLCRPFSLGPRGTWGHNLDSDRQLGTGLVVFFLQSVEASVLN